MEGDLETPKPEVVKIDSTESWDSHLLQSKSDGTPYCGTFFSFLVPPISGHEPFFFEEMASSFHDITFLIVDVDDYKDIASKYEVKAMPTFLLIKEGVVVRKIVGANPDEIKKRIETLLQSNTPYVV